MLLSYTITEPALDLVHHH